MPRVVFPPQLLVRDQMGRFMQGGHGKAWSDGLVIGTASP